MTEIANNQPLLPIPKKSSAGSVVVVTGGSGFIGTHLIELLTDSGYQVVNLDVKKPMLASQLKLWKPCSILYRAELQKALVDNRAEFVIHLAAYASMEACSLDEFQVNTDGTANVIEAVRSCSSVCRLIVTSTQHVRAPGSGDPRSDADYIPYMFYGESKVITERHTRDADLQCSWVIIRPTAVWGPGHKLLAEGLWKQMRKGRYVHPAADPVVRSYGYVKNVVWQIVGLLQAPREEIDRKVFYVADGNSRQQEWVNAISRELVGREVRTVPLWVLRTLSKVGDGMRQCGLPFPLYDSRLKNMITPNPVPVEPILKLLGPPPYSLAQGARETADWLKAYYEGKVR